jgi:hypothetical protein
MGGKLCYLRRILALPHTALKRRSRGSIGGDRGGLLQRTGLMRLAFLSYLGLLIRISSTKATAQHSGAPRGWPALGKHASGRCSSWRLRTSGFTSAFIFTSGRPRRPRIRRLATCCIHAVYQTLAATYSEWGGVRMVRAAPQFRCHRKI